MRAFFVLIFVSIVFVNAGAGTLYQWKDEDGRTHFTDNPHLVPEQHRDDSNRELPDYAVAQEEKMSRADMGKAIWENKCISCHALEAGQEGKRDLSAILTDNVTNGISNVAVVAPTLFAALGDKNKHDTKEVLSREDIQILAEYLLTKNDELLNSMDPNSY